MKRGLIRNIYTIKMTDQYKDSTKESV